MSSTLRRAPFCALMTLFLTATLGTWSVPGRAATARSPIFDDKFANGIVEDSDAIPGFWTNQSGKGSIAESGGRLTLTATGDAYAAATLLSGVRPEFNFWKSALTFSVKGITFRGTGAAPDQQAMRFAVLPESRVPYLAATGLELRLSADNMIVLGYKAGQTDPQKHSDPEWTNRLQLAKAPGTIHGFDLTLAATGYVLVVHSDDAAGKPATTCLTGSFTDQGPGLKATDWGTGGSAICLQGQKGTGKNDSTVTIQLTEVSVGAAATAASGDDRN